MFGAENISDVVKMADSLEDRVLKKNIPGKYSWWDDHHDDVRKEENDEETPNSVPVNDDDKYYHQSDSSFLGPSTESMNGYRNGSNTGVRGVIADFKESKECQKYAREMDLRKTQDAIERLTLGAKLKPGELSISTAANKRREKEKRHFQQENIDNDSEDDSFDDSEDEFFSSYRQQRILQLEKRSISNWPVYDGELLDVTPIQFSEIIDDTDPRVWVIILLYESFIPSCRLVTDHLRILAKTMTFCRFLCLRASSTKSKIDPVGLPSLIMYRGGNLEVNLTPVTDHLPQKSCENPSNSNFTVEEIKWLLESLGVTDPFTC